MTAGRWTRWCATRHDREGFTILELMVVLAIAAALITIAVPSMQGVLASRQLGTARNALIGSAARARAESIQRGEVVRWKILQSADTVLTYTASDTIAVLDYRGDLRGDIRLSRDGDLTLCFTPRGFAHPACGDADELPMRIGFTLGNDTVTLVLTALGQVKTQ